MIIYIIKAFIWGLDAHLPLHIVSFSFSYSFRIPRIYVKSNDFRNLNPEKTWGTENNFCCDIYFCSE